MRNQEFSLSVVIPTYNRADYLERALESLSRCRGVDEILVVNDGSTDETGEVLEKWRPRFNMMIVEHEERLGTPRSFNEAIRSNCDIVFFTADDHVYPDTDLFVEMRRHFSREEVGIVGCRMVKDGKSSFRLPGKDSGIPKLLTNLRKVLDDRSRYIDVNHEYVVGAMAVRRGILDSVKFSTEYGGNCNYEEQDFQKRVHDLGYEIFYDSSLIIRHTPAKSGGHRRFKEKGYLYWHFRNRMIYLTRHSRWRLLFYPVLHILRNWFFRRYPKTFLRACLDGFKLGILAKEVGRYD
ncbi:MAG: glycosyltransferase family 2 protein [Candidatus Bathyarchaeia archaeon]